MIKSTTVEQPKKNPAFDTLLARAFTDWPKEVDVGEIQHASPEKKAVNSYTLSGLGDWVDEIDERYLGDPERVLKTNMHDAIYIVLHKAGFYCGVIKLQDLRKELIQKWFETLLQDAANEEELGWSLEALALVKSYFAAAEES